MPIAEREDSLALGLALLDGKAEPAPTAAKVREEIADQQRRVLALEAAAQEAHNELVATIGENRSAWSQDAVREAGKARGRYESALAELEDARGNLSAAVGLFGWVSSGGAAAAEPANNQLAGSGHSFAEVLAALRADLEHLAGFDPLEREQPVRVAFRAYLAGARMTPPYYPHPSEIVRAARATAQRECRRCGTFVPDAAWRATLELSGYTGPVAVDADAGNRTCARCLYEQRKAERWADRVIAEDDERRRPSCPPLGLRVG